MLRAVVDPGVLVSALISKTGKPAQLILRWTEGAFDLIVSPALLHELSEVLGRPKFERYIEPGDALAYIARLSREALVVDDPVDVGPGLTLDPGDDYLMALARSSGAHVVVSGDPHLTEIENARPPVMTPRAFLERLSA